MMDITVNELLRRKNAVQNHQIRSDLVASTPKNQLEKAQAFSLQKQIPVSGKNPDIHFSGNESFPGLSCADKVGEKRKRNEYDEIVNTENGSKSEDVIVNLSKICNRRVADGFGGAGEEIGSGKQLHEVLHLCKETLPNAMNRNSQVGAAMGASQNLEVDNNSGLCDTSSEVAVQPKTSECAGPKFNDFDKLREVNFAVGQTLAIYDTVDGMPRLYAQIRKVSVPCFGLRITYLEPDPDKEKEIRWFEEDLPVSVDYADEVGVYVAYLHKAKGFATVFFRMGTSYKGIFRISPHSLYRFSHRVPSFKLTGIEGQGVPKDAYELDQAALPEAIEENIVPSNSDSNGKSKRQTIYFASKGKLFQTGQIWSYYSCNDELPLYYGKIQKITFTQVFKQEPVLSYT